MAGTFLCFTCNPSPKPALPKPYDNPTSHQRAAQDQWLSHLKTKATCDLHGYNFLSRYHVILVIEASHCVVTKSVVCVTSHHNARVPEKKKIDTLGPILSG